MRTVSQLAPGAEAVDAAFDGALLDVLGTLRATGKADELVKVPTFGKLAAPLAARRRPRQGPTGRGAGAPRVRCRRPRADRQEACAEHAAALHVGAAVEGTLLGAYAFTEYKSEKGEGPVAKVDFVGPPTAPRRTRPR